MTITIDSKLEARLRERAEAEGNTVPAYFERLVQADQSAEEEIESLALEGLQSGDPIKAGPGYWEEKHRRLDERLKRPALGERKSLRRKTQSRPGSRRASLLLRQPSILDEVVQNVADQAALADIAKADANNIYDWVTEQAVNVYLRVRNRYYSNQWVKSSAPS